MFDFSQIGKSLRLQTIVLVLFILVIGIISAITALVHSYIPNLSYLLFFPLITLLPIVYSTFRHLHNLNVHQQTMVVFLMIVWLSHLVQVFVPETGFDAVWYHLPVIKLIVTNQGLIFDKDLYQSLNPLFSDLMFGLGYFQLGDMGTKVVAYLFATGLMLVSYQLARKFVGKTSALLFTFMISTFQVISWQSASFYIDSAKAFWEISAIWLLIEYLDNNKKIDKYLFLSALLFSASLATKIFSVILLPVLLVVLIINKRYLASLVFLFVSFLLPSIFYFFSYQQTGDPLYVLNHINISIWQIAGYSDIATYLKARTMSLLISPVVLLLSADYVSIGVVALLPMLIIYFKHIKKNIKIVSLLIFSLIQWVVWWYLPPISTRYALSGFITLSLVIIYLIGKIKKNNLRKLVIALLIVSIWINVLPRFYVNIRSMRYILGFETKEQYLEHFYDGWSDNLLKNWHQIE